MPKPKSARLGLATTREILEELRARGDVAMAVYPYTELGADGAVLSGLASAGIKAVGEEILAYRTVDSQ